MQQITLLLRVAAAPNTMKEYQGDTPLKITTAVEMAAEWEHEIVAVCFCPIQLHIRKNIRMYLSRNAGKPQMTYLLGQHRLSAVLSAGVLLGR